MLSFGYRFEPKIKDSSKSKRREEPVSRLASSCDDECKCGQCEKYETYVGPCCSTDRHCQAMLERFRTGVVSQELSEDGILLSKTRKICPMCIANKRVQRCCHSSNEFIQHAHYVGQPVVRFISQARRSET